MEINRQQLGRLRDAIATLVELEHALTGKNEEETKWEAYQNQTYRVIAEVKLKGGIVEMAEWKKILKENNRDARASGGFHIKLMRRIAGDKSALTEQGDREIIDWLKGNFDAQPTKEDIAKYGHLIP